MSVSSKSAATATFESFAQSGSSEREPRSRAMRWAWRAGRMTRRASAIVGSTAMVTVGACADSPQTRATNACAAQLDVSGSPVRLLLGADGIQSLCDCTVTKVYERVPDAADKVEAWTAAVESRLDARGLLGVIADTAWFHRRADELDSFGAAFGPALAECTRAVIKEAGKSANGSRGSGRIIAVRAGVQARSSARL